MEPKIEVKKGKEEKMVWTLAHQAVESGELYKMRDRCVQQSKTTKNGMEATMLLRLAIDADHVARLMDERTGTKQLMFKVSVKKKASAKARNR